MTQWQSECIFHIPSSTTDLREGQLDTPDLTLVAETVLSDGLEFSITSYGISIGTHDMTRSTLLISGRRVLTDGPTRRLR
jgi:hypothetical protein